MEFIRKHVFWVLMAIISSAFALQFMSTIEVEPSQGEGVLLVRDPHGRLLRYEGKVEASDSVYCLHPIRVVPQP